MNQNLSGSGETSTTQLQALGAQIRAQRKSLRLSATVTAVALWAGFTAARFITHDAFEGRPTNLTVMNIAHELVTVVVMAIIIGVWPPALG